MVADLVDLDVELLGRHQLVEHLLAGARLRHDCDLSDEILDLLDAGILLGHHAIGGDEGDQGKVDLLLTAQRIDGRSALDVDGAVCDQRHAVLDVDRHVFDLQVRQVELLLHRIGDLEAELDRVADNFLVVVDVGMRDGGFAVTDREGLGLAQLLDDGVDILGRHWTCCRDGDQPCCQAKSCQAKIRAPHRLSGHDAASPLHPDALMH